MLLHMRRHLSCCYNEKTICKTKPVLNFLLLKGKPKAFLKTLEKRTHYVIQTNCMKANNIDYILQLAAPKQCGGIPKRVLTLVNA